MPSFNQWDTWLVRDWPVYDPKLLRQGIKTKERPGVIICDAVRLAMDGCVRCWEVSGEHHPERSISLRVDHPSPIQHDAGFTKTSWIYPTIEERFNPGIPPFNRRIGFMNSATIATLKVYLSVVGYPPIPK